MKKLLMIMLCAGSVITALSSCATQEGQNTSTDSTMMSTDTTMMDTITRDTVVTDTVRRDSM